MALVRISGQDVNIDIRDELEAFEWERPKWSYDKLIAASPFRYDRSPSFFVHLDGEYAGAWGDSGAHDDEWKSGNFTKLLSFLRNETMEETSEYLSEKYLENYDNRDKLLILPHLRTKARQRTLSHDTIERTISPYLTKRGISSEVQALAGVGKSRHYGFVALPWYTADGRLANVKYRSTRGKTFFYEKDATPIRSLIFGANLYTTDDNDLIVCEAEIDALSWRTAGFNAVAVGGVAFTTLQADILRRMPFKRLLLAGDNDKAGQAFNARIVQSINDRPIALIQLDDAYKDANEALVSEGCGILREAVANALDLPLLCINLR